MTKLQALIRQLDTVLMVLPVCVTIERARLTENYYKKSADAYQTVSLAEKKERVKNTCSSNE